MTDWDKLKEEKQRSISLCEARNGAILLLKDVRSDKWDSLYKETVRNLFKLNRELDNELLQGKGAGKNEGTARSGSKFPQSR